MATTARPEPMGSEPSSSDEMCFCGHKRSEHWDGRDDYTGCKARLVNDQQDNCTRFRLAPPLGGQTVSEGPLQGEVCVGSLAQKQLHRPTVRGQEGRCFICEPLTATEFIGMPETIDVAEETEEKQECLHCVEAPCFDSCPCTGPGCAECLQPMEPVEICEEPHMTIAEEDACEAIRRPTVWSGSIRYAVEGGQQYTLMLPTGSTVAVEDGVIKISHTRPALGIVAVNT